MFMFSINLTFKLVIQSPEVEKNLLYRNKICRQDPTFGSLKRGFHCIGVCYIQGMCQTNYCNFARTNSVLRHNGNFVISGFFIPGFYCMLIKLIVNKN